MKKPTEIRLMQIVVENDGRIPVRLWGILDKRHYYYLDKWTSAGFWEYGVSARGGWWTEEGEKYFREAANVSA